jgi:hypothetical protein
MRITKLKFKKQMIISNDMTAEEKNVCRLNNFVLWIQSLDRGQVDLAIAELQSLIVVAENKGIDCTEQKEKMKTYLQIKENIYYLTLPKKVSDRKKYLTALGDVYGLSEGEVEYIWDVYYSLFKH